MFGSLKIFADALVDEVLKEAPRKKGFADIVQYTKGWMGRIGVRNVKNKDEVWRFFVYHVFGQGLTGTVVDELYNKIPKNGVTLNVDRIINGLKDVEEKCEEVKGLLSSRGSIAECDAEKSVPTVEIPPELVEEAMRIAEEAGCLKCPVSLIMEEVKHRFATRIAKTLVEVVGKHLIKYGGDFNKWYDEVLKESGGDVGKATERMYKELSNTWGLRGRGKIVSFFLADLAVPIKLWNLDEKSEKLCPVDVNVRRLSKRFGFVRKGATDEEIQAALKAYYPDVPRKLDFALYLLGSPSELNICGEKPNCGECQQLLPTVYQLCPARSP